MRFKSTRGRLDHYFPPTASSSERETIPALKRPSLADLPLHILRRIFSYSGKLHVNHPIDLNFNPFRDLYNPEAFYFHWAEKQRMWDENHLEGWPRCVHYTEIRCSCAVEEDDGQHSDTSCETSYHNIFDPGILRLSHSITTVSLELLYGQNDFFIRSSGPGGFNPLLKLKREHLRLITSLHVYLDAPYPIQDCRCTCESCYPWCWSRPLAHKCDGPRCMCSARALEDWRRLCDHLAKLLSLNRLRLTLDCEVRLSTSRLFDYSLAERVLEPLFQLPSVAKCSIRLSSYHDDRLKDMARNAVSRVTGRAKASFALFNRLPKELRYHVISQTELVVPFALIWTGDAYGTLYRFWRLYALWTKEQSAKTSSFECCWNCDLVSIGRLGCANCHPDQGTGFASQCRLWHFPVELFSISHEIADFSLRAFVSLNRFVHLANFESRYGVADWTNVPHEPFLHLPYTPLVRGPKVGATLLLRCLQPRTWHLLRHIDIVFRVLSSEYMTRDGTIEDWSEFISLLKNGNQLGQLTLSRLSLRISILLYLRTLRPHGSRSELLSEVCHRIVSPFYPINDLRSFRVIVIQVKSNLDPLTTTTEALQSDQIDPNELEARLEESVMQKKYRPVLDRDKDRGLWLKEFYHPEPCWWGPIERYAWDLYPEDQWHDNHM